VTGARDDDPRLGEVVVAADEIRRRVAELGAEITRDYADRTPLLVGILKGAFVFLADLARSIERPVEVDFMAVSSYGSSTRTSGVVRLLKDLDVDLGGRDVILVEDIADSGLTLRYLRRSLMARRPASVEICCLLVREGATDLQDLVRYQGFQVPPGWVVGYGLDVDERYRHLDDIVAYNTEMRR
jgi:hypoxanthine phosphoribosyltransferase